MSNKDNLEIGTSINDKIVFIKLHSDALTLSANLSPEDALFVAEQLRANAENIINANLEASKDCRRGVF